MMIADTRKRLSPTTNNLSEFPLDVDQQEMMDAKNMKLEEEEVEVKVEDIKTEVDENAVPQEDIKVEVNENKKPKKVPTRASARLQFAKKLQVTNSDEYKERQKRVQDKLNAQLEDCQKVVGNVDRDNPAHKIVFLHMLGLRAKSDHDVKVKTVVQSIKNLKTELPHVGLEKNLDIPIVEDDSTSKVGKMIINKAQDVHDKTEPGKTEINQDDSSNTSYQSIESGYISTTTSASNRKRRTPLNTKAPNATSAAPSRKRKSTSAPTTASSKKIKISLDTTSKATASVSIKKRKVPLDTTNSTVSVSSRKRKVTVDTTTTTKVPTVSTSIKRRKFSSDVTTTKAPNIVTLFVNDAKKRRVSRRKLVPVKLKPVDPNKYFSPWRAEVRVPVEMIKNTKEEVKLNDLDRGKSNNKEEDDGFDEELEGIPVTESLKNPRFNGESFNHDTYSIKEEEEDDGFDEELDGVPLSEAMKDPRFKGLTFNCEPYDPYSLWAINRRLKAFNTDIFIVVKRRKVT